MHKSILLGHSQIYFIRSSSCPIWNVRPVAYDVQRYRPGLWSQNSNFSLQFRLQASTFFDSNIDKFLVPVPAPATERFALLKTTVLIVQLARPTSYDCGTSTKISGSSSGSTIKKNLVPAPTIQNLGLRHQAQDPAPREPTGVNNQSFELCHFSLLSGLCYHRSSPRVDEGLQRHKLWDRTQQPFLVPTIKTVVKLGLIRLHLKTLAKQAMEL